MPGFVSAGRSGRPRNFEFSEDQKFGRRPRAGDWKFWRTQTNYASDNAPRHTMNSPLFSRSRILVMMLAVAGLGAGWVLATDKPPGNPPLRLQSAPAAPDRSASARVSYSSVVKKTAPAVVYVFSSKKVRTPEYMEPYFNDPMFRRFFGNPGPGNGRMPREQSQQSLGSGVIVTPDGYVVTNNHVVDGADEVKVAVGEPRKEYEAHVVGRDEKADLALLKIDATGLPALTLGDSDKLEVGDTVLAIGNPFGIGLTVTHGIVSALGRGGLGIESYEDFIQTDAAINPGNSGGALVDTEGRLIGINTAILSRTGTSNGVGFAIPSNLVSSVLDQLAAHGRVNRAFLGVATQPLSDDLAKQFGLEHGALVAEVTPGSAAEKAGLREGDVITKVNGTEVTDPRILRDHRPADLRHRSHGRLPARRQDRDRQNQARRAGQPAFDRRRQGRRS